MEKIGKPRETGRERPRETRGKDEPPVIPMAFLARARSLEGGFHEARRWERVAYTSCTIHVRGSAIFFENKPRDTRAETFARATGGADIVVTGGKIAKTSRPKQTRRDSGKLNKVRKDRRRLMKDA